MNRFVAVTLRVRKVTSMAGLTALLVSPAFAVPQIANPLPDAPGGRPAPRGGCPGKIQLNGVSLAADATYLTPVVSLVKKRPTVYKSHRMRYASVHAYWLCRTVKREGLIVRGNPRVMPKWVSRCHTHMEREEHRHFLRSSWRTLYSSDEMGFQTKESEVADRGDSQNCRTFVVKRRQWFPLNDEPVVTDRVRTELLLKDGSNTMQRPYWPTVDVDLSPWKW